MIQITLTYHCRNCHSTNIVRNGTNQCGNAQYHCKDCGAYGVLEPHQPYTQEMRDTILRTYKERASLRGLERIFKVGRQTISAWIMAYVHRLPPLRATLAPAQADDVLELDEMWSFVGCKAEKRWLWTVMCRRTRQIIAFVIGDHTQETCKRLWTRIPEAYRRCHSYSDFWKAYQALPQETHQCVGKETGQTAHMERWYNTLRQRVGRVVRKTLSFSKSEAFHNMVLKWFIAEYNLEHVGATGPSLTI
jgi:IS1 family transposase/transposase-like protein